jgi:hypothetical protein
MSIALDPGLAIATSHPHDPLSQSFCTLNRNNLIHPAHIGPAHAQGNYAGLANNGLYFSENNAASQRWTSPPPDFNNPHPQINFYPPYTTRLSMGLTQPTVESNPSNVNVTLYGNRVQDSQDNTNETGHGAGL